MYRNYPFFKDLLDVFMRGLSAKNQTRNNKRRYLLRMDLAHALSTNIYR
jgi:hypothetical protein